MKFRKLAVWLRTMAQLIPKSNAAKLFRIHVAETFDCKFADQTGMCELRFVPSMYFGMDHGGGS